MLLKKKKIKDKASIEIPEELKELIKEYTERRKNPPKDEYPKVKYSKMIDLSFLDKAENEIKNTKPKPTFKDILFKHIDDSGLKDSEVYKKAHIDRRIFNKIKNKKDYHVSEETAICLGLALELPLDEFEELLKANYTALWYGSYFDIAIKWCVEHKVYDIEQVNDILYACDLKLLIKNK